MNRRTFLKRAAAGGAAASMAGCTGQQQGEPEVQTVIRTVEGEERTVVKTRVVERTPTPEPLTVPDPYLVGSPSPAQPVYNYAINPLFENTMRDAHGVDVNLKTHRGFTPMVAGLVREEFDIGYLTLPTYINARKQGFPLISPLSFLKEFDFILIGSADMQSVDELEGKTIALHSPQSMSTMTGKTIVKEEFGSVDAANYEFIIGTPNRLAALEAGNVDAAVVFLSGALQGQKDGYAKILANPWDYDVLASMTATTWVTLQERVEEDADLIQEVVTQMLDAYERAYTADPQEVTRQAIDSGIYPPFDDDVWLESFERVRDIRIWPTDQGGLIASQWERAMDRLVDIGLLADEDRIAPRELYTTEFL